MIGSLGVPRAMFGCPSPAVSALTMLTPGPLMRICPPLRSIV